MSTTKQTLSTTYFIINIVKGNDCQSTIDYWVDIVKEEIDHTTI